MDSEAFQVIASLAQDALELAADHAANDNPELAAYHLFEAADKLLQLRALLPVSSGPLSVTALNAATPEPTNDQTGTPSQAHR